MKKRMHFVVLLMLILAGSLCGESYASSGSGTGFFVTDNGVLVTCAHVIEDAERITVRIDETEYKAEILWEDVDTDLAILRINYRNPSYFRLLNFDSVELGDEVFVLGFPLSQILGSDIRLTNGIVSARSGINADQTYFQISAPIQPGNSGGPIFNDKFEVIGVAAHKLNDMSTLASAGTIPQNVNFGVKSDFVNSMARDSSPGNGYVSSTNEATTATVQIFTYESQENRGSSIQIANRTGYTVYYAYVSPAVSDTWGSDRLGAGVLLNGQNATVSALDFSSSNIYDIMLIDEDNDTYSMRNIPLSQNQIVEFTLDHIDGTTPINALAQTGQTMTIVNRTGYTVYYVYVSPRASDTWGADLLGRDVLRDGQSVRVPLPHSANNQYDIRLVDSDNDSYTKSNINVVPNQTVEFTFSDYDGRSTPQTGQTITIVNRTGYTVYYAYVSPRASDTWGADLLGSDVLLNGQSVRVPLPHSANNQYDIRLVDSDSDSYTKSNINVVPNQTVEFTFSDYDGSMPPTGQTITIVNRTGYTVWYVYVSPRASDTWGADLLGSDVLPNGQSVRVPLPQSANNQYDIRIVDRDSDSYTKSNINVVPNQTIEFTIWDLDI